VKTDEVVFRPYRTDDEAAVLACLEASLGGGPAGKRPREFFHWKHMANPFGSSLMLVAEADGRIAGLRAFMRWRFRAGSDSFDAVRAVDTATHPDFRGGGIFQRLTLAALDMLRHEGVDLVFNTPNPDSLRGYLKMGWKIVGRMPISIRVLRPARFIARSRAQVPLNGEPPAPTAPPAREVLASGEIEDLVRDHPVDARFHTDRTAEYLRWRYADAPLLDYRAVTHRDRDGRLDGLSIYRVRPRGGRWEATLAELVTRPGDRTVTRETLRAVHRTCHADHVACHFPRGSDAAAAARRAGYVRVPGGMVFVTRPVREKLDPNPMDQDSWALSVGDLEVF